MARPGFASQYDTLLDREIALRTASFRELLLLLGQPVLLGYVIGLAWRSAEAEPATFFSMSIAIVYLGCMNACCAIVRERAVYDRERMFELSIRAYLLSKLAVLAVISSVQAALLLFTQSRLMALPPGLGNHILLLLVMAGTGITATSLGLFISACATSSHGAVIAVPSLIVPQIVFSEVVLRSHIDKKVPAFMEKLTITKWCQDALVMLSEEVDLDIMVKSVFALAVQLTVLMVLSATKLRLEEV